MTEKEKMIAGLFYDPSDEELEVLLLKARKLGLPNPVRLGNRRFMVVLL